MVKVIRRALPGGSLALASAGLTQVTSSESASALPAGCAPRTRTVVAQSGAPTYAAIGTAGKYNSSGRTSPLHYTLSMSTSRSTSWTATAKASVSWGIAQVEGSTSYNVTKTSTTGVTDDLPVPANRYGYDQPKVECRRFHIYTQELNPSCTWSTSIDYGYLKAITTVPFFSSCTAMSACTPKP